MSDKELLKRQAYRESVLRFYNDTLLDKGLISESEHQAMQMKISSTYDLGRSGQKPSLPIHSSVTI